MFYAFSHLKGQYCTAILGEKEKAARERQGFLFFYIGGTISPELLHLREVESVSYAMNMRGVDLGAISLEPLVPANKKK